MDRSLQESADNAGVLVQMRAALRRTLTRLRLVDAAFDDCAVRVSPTGNGHCVVLAFPIRGEALLVRLAGVLRDSLMCNAPGAGPFLLTLSRVPRSRLSIDAAAYVEFRTETATFQLTVETAPDARMTLETGDFDTLVKFVVEYIAEKRRDPHQLEVAS